MDYQYPFLTTEFEPVGGELRAELEDFVVEEIPAYEPSGEGDHVLVEIEKSGLTTREAVRQIAQALDVSPRDAGWAGMKDRHAVTRQWLSFFGTDPDRARAVDVEGIRVISSGRHQHKLRVGHLRGNRFAIRLRGADPAKLETAQSVLEVLASVGCPNYFGEQRFGRGGETYTDARRWLIDEGRAPRSRFKRKLLVSTLQSHAFNAVVADRVVAQTLDKAIAGDVLKKEDSGGLFVCTDVSADQARVRDWQVSPTGPMFGRKMSRAEGTVGEYESKIFETEGFTDEVLRRFGKLGLGTRRPLRVQPHDWSVDADEFGLLFRFHLSPGSYATTLLREVRKSY